MVFDQDDNILIVQLNDYSLAQWGFPGGGRAEHEDGQQNALRELTEEMGLPATDFQVIAKSKTTYTYDFPDEMRQNRVPIALQYRGQIKEQYFIRFTGDKSRIVIDTNELRAYKWIPATELHSHLLFEGQYELAKQSLAEYKTLRVAPDKSGP